MRNYAMGYRKDSDMSHNDKKWYQDSAATDWKVSERALEEQRKMLYCPTTVKKVMKLYPGFNAEQLVPSTPSEVDLSFYRRCLLEARYNLHNKKTTESECFCTQLSVEMDWVWSSSGRPRWLVDRDTVNILLQTSIDTDVSNVTFPYDVFDLVFERGTEILDGIPLRWIRISNMKSKHTNVLLSELCGHEWVGGESHWATLAVDTGLSIDTRVYSQDTQPGDSNVAISRIDLTKTRQENEHALEQYALQKGVNADPAQTNAAQNIAKVANAAQQIAFAAVLYWNARPEFIKDYSIPRSSRYQFKERSVVKRVLIPTIKVVRPPDDQPNAGTGSKKRPHLRGWVLKTLRAERFHRNPDGSFRVISVEPCLIHADQYEASSAGD